MSTERIRIRCECAHEAQDRMYGKGIRVGVPVDKSRKRGQGCLSEVTCSVCGKLHVYAGREVVRGANSGRG